VSSVLVNNLPAASLLAARQPPHPFALLIGLNVGPNLFVTGSLAWILWLRAARAAGGRPDVRRASLLGLISVPLAMAAAVGVLVLSGTT
jgi:arsenical pump membrane protein